MSQNATNPGTHLFVWRIQWDNACKYLARCKDLITVGCYYHTHVSSKSGSGWFSSWVVGLLGTTHSLSPEPSDPPDKMHGYQWAHSTTCPCGSLPQALLRSRFCSSHLGSSRIVTPKRGPSGTLVWSQTWMLPRSLAVTWGTTSLLPAGFLEENVNRNSY